MNALAVANLATPAPDPAEWISAAQAAAILGQDVGHLSRLCREKLQHIGQALFSQGTGQGQWLLHRNYDLRLKALAGFPDLSDYSDRQRTEALQRLTCVQVWNDRRMNSKESIERVVGAVLADLRARFPQLKLSRSSLYEWSKTYRRPADLVKLIDVRGGAQRGDGTAAAWKLFDAEYCQDSRPSIRHCWMTVDRLAKENGLSWCSLKSCTAQLDQRISPERQLFHREPERWRTQMAPYIPQDPEAWGAGELWISDHKQFDLICTFAGQKIRPWLTAWLDWRTRKLTGWALTDNPNSTTILAAMRHGLKDESNFGGPREITVDHGKDFEAWMFHGQTKKQRQQKINVDLDKPKADGIFNHLGIKAHFALPYNANGKARLERWFRTLEAFFKTFDTYTGESIDVRPERLAEILDNPLKIPTFDQVKSRLADHIAGYNLQPDHGRDDMIDGGVRLSPNEAFARWSNKRIMADPSALDLLLAVWHRPVPVTREGVTINVSGQSLSYGMFEIALSPFKALKKQDRPLVKVSYDPHDLRSVRIHNEAFELICVATLNEMGGARDAIGVEHVKELIRKQAAYKREVRRKNELGIDSVLTAEEHLAKIAADARPQPPREQPTMQIVQTPLDGQSKNPAREKLRQAVGSESIDFPAENPMELLRQNQQRQSARVDEELPDIMQEMRERNGW